MKHWINKIIDFSEFELCWETFGMMQENNCTEKPTEKLHSSSTCQSLQFRDLIINELAGKFTATHWTEGNVRDTDGCLSMRDGVFGDTVTDAL